jgi:hypothetical protein
MPAIDFNAYSTILFIDSMVALEAKPLAMLPWHEIDDTGPILVLVVPQVNKEIDKRKRDGRLGQRARAFNRLIARAAEAASAVRIYEGQVVVDIALAVCERIDWTAYDDLDPEDGDARVVAEILHSRGAPSDRKLLFSHDINPIAMAARHGLKRRKMPDHWLLEPEPSPNEKEMTRLKARVRELEATAPDLQATIIFEVSPPLQLFQVRPLSEEQRAELARRVLAKNPKPLQPGSRASPDYDRSLDKRYEEYETLAVPRFASRLHLHLETHYSQIPFLLRIENIGHVQAENLVIELKAFGGTLHDRFVCYPLLGPPVPQPKSPRFTSFPDYSPASAFLRRAVERHEFEFAVGPRQGHTIEIHCADFRQGSKWDFQGIASIDSRAASPFKLQVELTASNLRGVLHRSFELPYNTQRVSPGELISLDTSEYRVEFPMHKQWDKAVETDNWKWFDFGNEEDKQH